MFAAQGLIVQETRSSAHLTERATLWQALSEVNQTSAIFRSTPLINWFRYRICCTSLELQDPKTVPTFAFCLQPMGMASSSPGIFPFFKNQSHRWLFYFQGRKFSCEPWPGIPELPSLPSSHIGHDHEVFSILSNKLYRATISFLFPIWVVFFCREGDQNETESKTNTHMVMQWGQVRI